jgi:hypothetical protein
VWEEKVAKGLEVAKHRAGRSDQGIPRKRARGGHAKENHTGSGDVEEDGNNDDVDTDEEATHPAPKKRAKITPTAGSAKPVGKKTATTKKIPAKKVPATSRTRDATRQVVKAKCPRKAASKAIITSEDELDDDPEADKEVDGVSLIAGSALVVYAPPAA